MPEKAATTPRHRYSISTRTTERELRRCGFALLNHFLTMHHVIAEHVHLQPVELLILIATTTGNVQRTMQAEALPEAFRASQGLPPDMVVPMSRRGIARATGLPTETVRRHVVWVDYSKLDFSKGGAEKELRVEQEIFSLNGDVTGRLKDAKPFVFASNKP